MPRSSIREDGALGVAFQVCRALQFACLIATMGMAARFVSEIVDGIQQPPATLIGVLCVACFAILYIVITYLLYFDGQLQKHYTAASDTLFFIALTVTSVIVGKPLSYLSCKAIGAVPTASFDSTKSFTNALNDGANQGYATPTTAFTTITQTATAAAMETTAAYLQPESGTVDHLRPRSTIDVQTVSYSVWVGSTERTCGMMKAVWGLAITLTILFAFSTLCLVFLWKKERTAPKERIIHSFKV